MNAAIKIDITKCPVPRLEPSYSKRVKVADSFDRHIQQLTERQDRLYNWRVEHSAPKPKRKGRGPSIWTQRRVDELIRRYNARQTLGEIADALHLAKSQIHSKCSELRKKGVLDKPMPPSNSWKEEDNAKIIQLYQRGLTYKEISTQVGRTECAVTAQIYNLRNKGVDIPARSGVHRKPASRSVND